MVRARSPGGGGGGEAGGPPTPELRAAVAGGGGPGPVCPEPCGLGEPCLHDVLGHPGGAARVRSGSWVKGWGFASASPFPLCLPYPGILKGRVEGRLRDQVTHQRCPHCLRCPAARSVITGHCH